MKKLLVIDGNSMINRAFYGIRMLTASDGRPTNAIYGLVNIVRSHLDTLAPDYACIAFDVQRPAFRTELYPAYKMGRHPTPPELKAQFADAKECMRLMGLTTLETPLYEADDVLATLSTMAESEGDTEAYILTGDRDLLQMISNRISVLLVTNTETVLFDRTHFHEVYGIEPESFIDVKALMGDSSDNIKGVAGIGEKTALRLISCFGSIESIYDNIDNPSVKGSVRDKLLAGRADAFLSKKIVSAVRDADLGVALADVAYKGYQSGLYDKLMSLDFRSLVRKMNLTETPQAETESKVCPCCFEKATEEEDASVILKALGDTVAVHTESDRLYLASEQASFVTSLSLSALTPLFDGGKTVVCFDCKALLHALDREGVDGTSTRYLDLLLYAYLLNPGSNAKDALDALSCAFDTPRDSIARPDDTACSIAPQMLKAEKLLRAKIEEVGMTALLDEMELPLALVLFDMEKRGFRIHRRGLTAFGEELDETIEALTTSIYEAAGEKINLNSSKQLGELLYVKLGLPATKRTKSGYSTDVEALEKLAPLYPIVQSILDYRHVSKLRSTYVTGLLRAADANDRVHTSFKQALTATGRLSSTDPNLQNIPVRTPLGREMRRFFIAEDDDHVLIDADYSQIELRLLAHMSGDATMIDAFKNDADIHRRTAALVFGLPEVAVSDELRSRAKAVNFGIVYGIGAFSLAKDLGVSNAQAKSYIEGYLSTYSGISAYMEKTVKDAADCGYTTTIFGRRRYIPELTASNKMLQAFGKRVAMNSPIQGSATDIIKRAMITVYRRLQSECPDAHLIMQVHDELIVEAPRAAADKAASILKEEMENACKLAVPLPADLTIAQNWLGDEA